MRRRLIRRKYVRRDHPFQAPVIVPLHLLQERSLAAPGRLAAIIVGKYCDHLPLYRQEQIWRTRHHLDIPRQTMVRWLAMAVQWLKPIHDHIRTEVMSGGYVQTDEPERSGDSQPCILKTLLANPGKVPESRQRKNQSGLFMSLAAVRILNQVQLRAVCVAKVCVANRFEILEKVCQIPVPEASLFPLWFCISMRRLIQVEQPLATN